MDVTHRGAMTTGEITVCVATIPPRGMQLTRALRSVALQVKQPKTIVIEYDHEREGARAVKNRALSKVDTEYVAFLDDDDEFTVDHLALLLYSALETNADVTYGWYRVVGGGGDPRPDRFNVPFDADELRRGSYIHTAPLVRAELLKKAGGFQWAPGSQLDDWGAWLAMLNNGATFHHLPVKTYIWYHDGNTSGQPDRW